MENIYLTEQNTKRLSETPRSIQNILKERSSNKLANLPSGCIDQLSSTFVRNIFIQEILQKAGGKISLDHFVIQWYRETGQLCERARLNTMLYRMVGKGLLYMVPGKKGVYSLEPITK